MYEIYGYAFLKGHANPIKEGTFVKSWDEAHAIFAKAKIQHYLITLVKKGD